MTSLPARLYVFASDFKKRADNRETCPSITFLLTLLLPLQLRFRSDECLYSFYGSRRVPRSLSKCLVAHFPNRIARYERGGWIRRKRRLER